MKIIKKPLNYGFFFVRVFLKKAPPDMEEPFNNSNKILIIM